MANGRQWTRDELLVVLNVYEKVPFGLFDQQQPVIRDLARRMRRTPGSVAMKLSNLASLDPAIKARGRKGLVGASNLDRQIWSEFQANRNELAAVSEGLFRKLFKVGETEEVELIKGVGVIRRKTREAPEGPTETRREVAVRRGQQFFQQMVLNAFNGCCSITGIKVRELLVASHILPWSSHPEERLNPQNGLCLSRIHDAAFDRGLITFDGDSRLVLSRELRSALANETMQHCFRRFEGNELSVPNKALPPRPEFLAFHRAHIFRS